MSIEMLSKEYINYIKRDRCSAVVELVLFWPSRIVSRKFLTRDMYPTSHPAMSSYPHDKWCRTFWLGRMKCGIDPKEGLSEGILPSVY